MLADIVHIGQRYFGDMDQSALAIREVQKDPEMGDLGNRAFYYISDRVTLVDDGLSLIPG
jgi:hypothetical protein